MRWIHSTRLGVLASIPIVMTAALTGPAWAAEPTSPAPAATTAVAGADARTSHVRELQLALSAAGYDPGPIDGIMGPRTKSAVRQYIAVPPPQGPSPADGALAPFRGNEAREAR